MAIEQMPEFTSDWLTAKLKHWRKHLTEFEGVPTRAIEVGSYEGRSALWLLDHVLTHCESDLTCIDPWPARDIENRFDRNTAGRNQIRKVKGYGQQELRKLPCGQFDLIYIDGDHSTPGTMTHSVLSWELLRNGGVLIWDDYLWTNPGKLDCDGTPRPAIEAFLAIYKPVVLHKGYQVIVRKP